MTPHPDNANRLVLGLVEELDLTYPEAEALLQTFTLRIVAHEGIATSAAAQAALLTAINTGQRCFLGGVKVEIDKAVALKLPFKPYLTLNDAIHYLDAPQVASEVFTETIHIGSPQAEIPSDDWLVYASGWRGGITVGRHPIVFDYDLQRDFSLGGVLAGGLAVHHAFLRAARLSDRLAEPWGFSLWELGSDWTKLASEGPVLNALPNAMWMIGLGHLGQAYLWTLALLPYSDPTTCTVMLQDFDRLKLANSSAAMLAQQSDVGVLKSLICANWLRLRGFSQILTCDRRFDERTVRFTSASAEEPHIALCGLDNLEGRRSLSNAAFMHVVDCGLGGSATDFDQVRVHTFPNSSYRSEELWKTKDIETINEKRLYALNRKEEICGVHALESSKVSISSSFVGAVAASLAIAEVLKMYQAGAQSEEIDLDLRCQGRLSTKLGQKYSRRELASCGFCPA
jgi:hypothetical protein